MKKIILCLIVTTSTLFSFAQSWNINGNANAAATSFLGTTTNLDLTFKANGVEALRLSAINGLASFNSTGNELAVFNSPNVSGAWLKVNSNNTNFNTGIGYRFSVNNTIKSQIFFNEGAFSQGTTIDGLVGNTDVLSRYGDVYLSTGIFKSNGLVVKKLTGNIGIGTVTPNNKVEIAHGTTGNSGLRFTNLTSSSTASLSSGKVLSVNSSGDVVLEAVNTVLGADGSETKINAGSNITIAGVGTSGSPYFISANMPIIPIPQWLVSSLGIGNIMNANTGAVVIGSGITTLPTGYKLYVSEGILAEKVKVALKSGANWADYVFNENYKLMPLSEVEKYIYENKHLPSVQSAAEIIKDGGVNVIQMFAKQMEKIEELTLYVVEQNKKIIALEKAIKIFSK